MSIGVRVKIDVSKIDKELLFKGSKGTYLDATVFIDPNQADQYGNHGMITQDVSKEARDKGEKGNILGNVVVFWTGDSSSQTGNTQKSSTAQSQAAPSSFDDFDSDLPF